MGLPIFFARDVADIPEEIVLCGRQNVVLHAKMATDPFRQYRRALFGHRQTQMPQADHMSSAKPDSQFRHCRYNLGKDGKILAFRSANNIIRAGKHTHADALVSCLLFLRWSKTDGWPTRINAPNMVLSGKFAKPPGPALKMHPTATYSLKFPGVAIKLPCGVTTEIYESGAFILPGITSAAQLNTALQEVAVAVTL